ncbi:McrB family protein [Heliorestis convoluta]|uniref:5-methylcytosine-specific restriction enzyme B n=1 Tax=Heliorestis convoluta TaxID=356322 RepID=A0A5Q2MZF7_9FIRM|nr:AAA family ATPase [Heliorestis convoluta]QGG48067.1 5-methylcytosine-specific restriction enzyme B [Heliorestis convoluta]
MKSFKVKAICTWLNKKHGQGKMLAWAKEDPVRTDLDIPNHIKQNFHSYHDAFKRYGKVIYGFFAPQEDQKMTEEALKAFLDLLLEERGQGLLKGSQKDGETIREAYFSHLMAPVNENEVLDLLRKKRFVILQGPPGTGKTRMARNIVERFYDHHGTTVQFHPNTTYENVIGGLAPLQSDKGLGFRFAPQKGFLMKAAEIAAQDPTRSYLLHIDEINRADLSKVLGEALYLLEAQEDKSRQLELPYDFGSPFGNRLTLPQNLHIIGTMNSADRSIAIVDIAVRRRFAFVKMWPQMAVVQKYGCPKI